MYAYSNSPPVYVEYRAHQYLVYWVFYGRNYSKVGPVKDVHEGDWEHIALRLDSLNHVTDSAYYQHTCPPDKAPPIWEVGAAVEGESPISNSHPAVFVARGSHAWFQTAGSHPASCRELGGFADFNDNAGLDWHTWDKGDSGFVRASDGTGGLEPWYGYGGSWGSNAGGDFWSPLGPGPLKQGETFPQEWLGGP